MHDSILKIHEANRKQWNSMAFEWERLRDEDGGWRKCPSEPDVAFEGQALETIMQFTGDLKGKKVCIVASGDNYAAFALAGLGADVTSTDISDEQLKYAKNRASELGLQIEFLQADAANLHMLADNTFDLVFSSNGFFVWLADLKAVFSEVARILKPGGHYIFYDVHPFNRPWKDQISPIEMLKPYWDNDPHRPENTRNSYEFHRTMAEILNALVDSGLNIRKIIESPSKNSRFWGGPSYGEGTHESLQDWRINPLAGLPVWLTVASIKP